MSDVNRTKTIFIKKDISLPATLSVESEEFLAQWRVVKNLDRYALTRKIESANWNFFNLAGEIRATVLGRDRPGALRRAVRRILAKQEGQKFNSMEITKVLSKRFLGIPFLRVTAHFRHIQPGIYLVPAKDDVSRMPVAAAPAEALDTGERQRHGEAVTKHYTALVSSS